MVHCWLLCTMMIRLGEGPGVLGEPRGEGPRGMILDSWPRLLGDFLCDVPSRLVDSPIGVVVVVPCTGLNMEVLLTALASKEVPPLLRLWMFKAMPIGRGTGGMSSSAWLFIGTDELVSRDCVVTTRPILITTLLVV